MAEFDSAQLRQWAARGAEQRLLEIAAEAAAIYKAFPELRDRSDKASSPATTAVAAKAGRRGRNNMSAAQRKAVSERMRKYWAGRRESAGGATSAGSAKAGAARPARTAAARGTRGPRKMSAAARKRISDAQKKRWAARRANG